MADRILRENEVTHLTGIDKRTIRRLELKGEFPRRRKITSRNVGWLASEIFRWIKKRVPVPTPQANI
jgi:prophage regulatory protein